MPTTWPNVGWQSRTNWTSALAALASTDEQQRAEQYRFILTTLHEQAVYLPISHLTAISVRRDSVAKVQFGSTLFDVPFETMTPKQGD